MYFIRFRFLLLLWIKGLFGNFRGRYPDLGVRVAPLAPLSPPNPAPFHGKAWKTDQSLFIIRWYDDGKVGRRHDRLLSLIVWDFANRKSKNRFSVRKRDRMRTNALSILAVVRIR